MTNELLNAVYNEVDEIKNLDCYKELVRLNNLIKIELKDLIKNFNETKNLLEKEDNKYSKNYLSLTDKLSKLRIELESNSLVKEYRLNESKLNKYLENLKNEMVKTVRGEK